MIPKQGDLVMKAIRPDSGQRGVALITAILVVALATAAGVAVATRQHIDIRRTENLLNADRAYLYALGGEAWAKAILARDRNDGDVDHLGEDWARKIPPLPVDGGSVSGYIEDMQGRFNINNLAVSGENFEIDLARFRRLLANVGLNESLADAVVDWVDPDIEPRFPDGAEDDFYLGQEPAYRTANRPMTSASELRLVRGFDQESVEKLLPYVVALPLATPVNVNTAPPPVLESLFAGLDESQVRQLVEAREEEAFNRVEDFLQHEVFRDLSPDASRLSVRSDYFAVTAEAVIGSSQVSLLSLIHRSGDNQFTVLGRSLGGL
ncbi:MAG: GspK family T2SS minor pseudopilin variant XcpX [Gammaproteobacteria bacterium]